MELPYEKMQKQRSSNSDCVHRTVVVDVDGRSKLSSPEVLDLCVVPTELQAELG